MISRAKIFFLILLGTTIIGLSGCATTDSDLGYERKTIDTNGDSSYHGWNSTPQEVSQ